MMDILSALFLGLVEGLTEFLPVSSTGHLILFVDLMKFNGPPGQVFEIVIQIGAIMAVVVAFFQRLWDVAKNTHKKPPKDKGARNFLMAIFLAFLPAMVIGFFAHDFIKQVLFNPTVVAVSFILGGVAILGIEKLAPKGAIRSIESMPLLTAFKIGVIQCLAMIPGVSRSGATIMGALVLGVERKTAAEFSFFLALPTLAAASAYDLYKNWGGLDGGSALLIAAGTATAFLSALLVAKTFIGFVGRYGFAPFAWYRIGAGFLMLALLFIA
jgi:undecaprenyl-diphosphatase